MVNGAKSCIPIQWTSAVSSWQHVAKHCHEAKLWKSLNCCKTSKCITFFFHVKPSYNLWNKILKEVIENYQRGHLRDQGSIPGWVIPKTQKRYLMPPCLTLSITRYGSRVKWNNPRKGIAPSSTPQCSSYWKGSLWVTLNYGCKLNLFIIKIC